jgi:hypothetical protein
MDQRLHAERNHPLETVIISDPAHQKCRDLYRKDAEGFLLYFYPHIFGDSLFEDQIEQVSDFQRAILTGGNKALAAMRGGGKTSIVRCLALWALLYNHSKYCVIIGATGADAENSIKFIKSELEQNQRIANCFPEITSPIAYLEGSSRRSGLHMVEGERTRMEYGRSKVILPHIRSDRLSKGQRKNGCGGIIEIRSIDGAVRGLNTNGIRPDLVLLDDLETRDSVKSIRTTDEIRLKIDTDIAGLAGQKSKLTMLYIGTIMADDSVTAEMTDPKRRPAFHGKRYQYMKDFPENVKLWEEYMKRRRDTDFYGPDNAKKFYKENWEEMQRGASVAWPEGYDPDMYEDAIEKFYATWADRGDNGVIFIACELQNDPSMLDNGDDDSLRVEFICRKLSGIEQNRIPSESNLLTGFIDVHGLNNVLYWGVTAYTQKFTGYLVDYGVFPEKGSIGDMFKGSQESAVGQALKALEKKLNERKWVTDSGTELAPTFGVDSGWGETQSVVYQFCRQSRNRNFFPTKGESVKGKNFNGMGNQDLLRGDNWREMRATKEKYQTMAYLFNADYWKRFTANRILTPFGENGCFSLYGSRPERHLDISKHCCAEKPKKLVEKGTSNEFEIWELMPNRQNHYWDVLVGCHLMAGIRGASMVSRNYMPAGMRPVRKARKA